MDDKGERTASFLPDLPLPDVLKRECFQMYTENRFSDINDLQHFKYVSVDARASLVAFVVKMQHTDFVQIKKLQPLGKLAGNAKFPLKERLYAVAFATNKTIMVCTDDFFRDVCVQFFDVDEPSAPQRIVVMGECMAWFGNTLLQSFQGGHCIAVYTYQNDINIQDEHVELRIMKFISRSRGNRQAEMFVNRPWTPMTKNDVICACRMLDQSHQTTQDGEYSNNELNVCIYHQRQKLFETVDASKTSWYCRTHLLADVHMTAMTYREQDKALIVGGQHVPTNGQRLLILSTDYMKTLLTAEHTG